MKLSSLLVPSLLVAPVIAARSTGEWVGDVKSITDAYRKTQTNVKAIKSSFGNHGELFFLTRSLLKCDEKVSAAVNQQQKASEPQLLPDNGAEGESNEACAAVAGYFPEFSTVGIETMNAFLNPEFACTESTKAAFGPAKCKKCPELWRKWNSDWDQYHTLFTLNCDAKYDDDTLQKFENSYAAFKDKFQEATDAYQDIGAWCAAKSS
ncbi:hypothetical protein N7533_001704 [Penicillium manginii]|uniref:uncharacterized protein n=1 Tax=Penicillium manginii TaxID=203109 RepID=UPI002547F592|nr:uncharacterized protein N7533_001704 [Penicillium manginii]KAJ5763023.1 hypothetical protein N7533_001704 [Penicillium manginii]